jgi:hypothetical protein
MVSINNNLSGLNNLNRQQSVVSPRRQATDNSGANAGKEFSSLVNSRQEKKTATLPKNDKPNVNISNFSPLMLRYGPNKIGEIKDIASSVGVNDLTNEDFDYAIRYGRSIMADYLV